MFDKKLLAAAAASGLMAVVSAAFAQVAYEDTLPDAVSRSEATETEPRPARTSCISSTRATRPRPIPRLTSS